MKAEKAVLVGLPNVGKSSLFTLLSGTFQSKIGNYPFCTLEPHIGQMVLEDERLNKLFKLFDNGDTKKVESIFEITDMAGIVPGECIGFNLGGSFMHTIAQHDLIILLIRCFDDENVFYHKDDYVHNSVEDYKTITQEFILWDLDRIEKTLKEKKKLTEEEKNILLQRLEQLEKKTSDNYSLGDLEVFNKFNLISHKKILVVGNGIKDSIQELNLKNLCNDKNLDYISINVKEEDKNEINLLIKNIYEKLNLITFFTCGEKEVRAWKVVKGSTYADGAEKIHSDYKKYFKAASQVTFEEFIKYESWGALRKQGKVKLKKEKDFINDGDIIIFQKK